VLKGFDFKGTDTVAAKHTDRVWPHSVLNWGYASSPLLFEDSLFVQVLHGMRTDDRPMFCASTRRRAQRSGESNGPHNAIMESPDSYNDSRVASLGTNTEIVITGGDCVTGHDPATGKELWRMNGLNPRTIPTSGSSRRHSYSMASCTLARNKPLLAIKAGGRGDITSTHKVWSFQNAGRSHSSHRWQILYVVTDNGVMWCVDAKTGTPSGGSSASSRALTVSSPVLADGKIYLTNEEA
jgi:hypothetical protein